MKLFDLEILKEVSYQEAALVGGLTVTNQQGSVVGQINECNVAGACTQVFYILDASSQTPTTKKTTKPSGKPSKYSVVMVNSGQKCS